MSWRSRIDTHAATGHSILLRYRRLLVDIGLIEKPPARLRTEVAQVAERGVDAVYPRVDPTLAILDRATGARVLQRHSAGRGHRLLQESPVLGLERNQTARGHAAVRNRRRARRQPEQIAALPVLGAPHRLVSSSPRDRPSRTAASVLNTRNVDAMPNTWSTSSMRPAARRPSWLRLNLAPLAFGVALDACS